ncbi:type II toxin-antitoxin system PemK/MazF family toxin [Planococcus lenghuensis]|uniref:Toxin MazF n=1 Tax=Planococcus lenghuensis TaxID=2213202 RepID=A0A1Q2KYP8_9BACL|nr:type II toxin-antitoxin system PemK/MazF family toxin [Planococcus lenghuensis]AQQ53330.1 toxin MazF [Planococcus lenghuensis]
MGYKAKQGDIIFADLNPRTGYEQAGKRPCLVVSNNFYNNLSNIAIVAPITNTVRAFPLNVPLTADNKTTGMVLCQHIRAIDTQARNAEFKETAASETLGKVLEILPKLF